MTALTKEQVTIPNNEELNAIVIKYKPLVMKFAHKYASSNKENLEDLIQAGMIGLLLAAKRYDSSKNVSFHSYAIPNIIGEIKHYLRDYTWSMKVSRTIKDIGSKLTSATEELRNKLGRMPQQDELARYLDITEEQLTEIVMAWDSYQPMSLSQPVQNEEDAVLIDILTSEEKGYDDIDMQLFLDELKQYLTPMEQEVFYYTVMKGLSQNKASLEIGISQMHVSRLRRRVVEKLSKVPIVHEWKNDLK
ncbi:sigma-70 family RNA polymerase sigma factor [Bacillus shivajii]|uniref:sigma-70 family RNA polymerase sigma factor n=1 Tax=Bacillus shivajii TaxID=1983719 RepID=UPI001CFA4EE1|nr:sigma-70 family RNA polymerase sigma factor [Bacillus shivajii]UCZ52418.1 sigma-70 family RNA polymerase sigma factor [Bacillus shivajii]